MSLELLGILIVCGLLLGMLGTLEIGRRLGVRRMKEDPDGAKAGAGAVEAAIFGLMGLLLGFTFSGAAARFDARRALLVEEANCIGTAWLRLDLLPATAQPDLREKFRHYTNARLEVFRKLPDVKASKAEGERANQLQNEIWTQTLAACRTSGEPFTYTLIVPALNQMFDIATTRTAGARMHPPGIIYAMLAVLLLASSLLAGYHMGAGQARSWFHSCAFVVVISLAFYVILDFEFPRVGVIRIQNFDQVLVDLRQSMK